MKISTLFQSAFICLSILVMISPVSAYWVEETFLDELNDYDSGISAHRPSISSDENTIFYTLADSRGNDWVWQATRNPETGVFDQQRQLIELNNRGEWTYGIWMSQDNLRLYYAGHDRSIWPIRPIWMATRNNVSESWQTIKRHAELELAEMQAQCSLTADEKTIMYELVTNPRRIILASRDSVDEPFSDIQDVYELEAIGASGTSMTADGLAVYFIRANESGKNELWTGSRASLDGPFTNFEPLTDVNSNLYRVSVTSPSWDGKRLYVKGRKEEVSTIDTNGIWVYQWVDPPEVVVEKNLTAAIEAKQAILEELTATIQMEIETLQILGQLQKMTVRGDTFFRTLQKTRINIRKALRNEILAQMKISESIRDLQKAADEYVY